MRPIAFLLLLACFVVPLRSQTGSRHVLLEEFSTAPCGFCPDGDLIAAQIVKDHPEVIWVTHHAGFGTDSMTASGSVTIANAFTTFAPGACIDRGDYPIPVYTMQPYIAVSRQKWDSVVTARLAQPPFAELRLTNAFSPATRQLALTVHTTFPAAPPPGDLRVNIFLVEDSVVGYGKGYDQKNYFNGTPGHPYYKKGDSIYGYVHHRVVRSVPLGAWGQAALPPAPAAGTWSCDFKDIPVSARWNSGNIDVVAFVSYFDADAKKRTVLASTHRMLLDGATSAVVDGNSPAPMQVVVYPNPVGALLQVRYSTPGKASSQFVVTDIRGRDVLRAELPADRGAASFPMHGLPAGMYLYRVSGGTGDMHRGTFLLVP